MIQGLIASTFFLEKSELDYNTASSSLEPLV